MCWRQFGDTCGAISLFTHQLLIPMWFYYLALPCNSLLLLLVTEKIVQSRANAAPQ
jgi:hypothetical protein